MDTCSIVGCLKTIKARGLCNSHYERLRIHGDPGGAKLLRSKATGFCKNHPDRPARTNLFGGVCGSCENKERYDKNPLLKHKMLKRVQAYNKKVRETDPILYAEKQVTRRLKHRYGINTEIFNNMVKQQLGSCAICGKIPNSILYVDHCHKTGKTRALLCAGCNTMVGNIETNPARIVKAINYIEMYSVDRTEVLDKNLDVLELKLSAERISK